MHESDGYVVQIKRASDEFPLSFLEKTTLLHVLNHLKANLPVLAVLFQEIRGSCEPHEDHKDPVRVENRSL